jgi:hypothetical protein
MEEADSGDEAGVDSAALEPLVIQTNEAERKLGPVPAECDPATEHGNRGSEVAAGTGGSNTTVGEAQVAAAWKRSQKMASATYATGVSIFLRPDCQLVLNMARSYTSEAVAALLLCMRKTRCVPS